MDRATDAIDRRLLDAWQRDFPLVPNPFGVIGARLGRPEAEIIARLKTLTARGMISRVGATCAPNVVSASTLAAMAVPDEKIDAVAALINRQSGVNHSYLRENRWNLWFVATGPDRAHVDAVLARIARQSGLRVLDLPLVRAFNIDLGFRLSGARRRPAAAPAPQRAALMRGDRRILQALSGGLALVARPFGALAAQLGRGEEAVLARIGVLLQMGLVTRIGIIVRHRALGWRSNAMVVWDMSRAQIATAGPRLAALPGITLCYERRPVAGVWPWRLYSMIHARSRPEAQAILESARDLPEFRDAPHLALFSTRCFRQTGALIRPPQAAAP